MSAKVEVADSPKQKDIQTLLRMATCACENLSVKCKGDPIRVAICHCFACQKRTGSVFSSQMRFLDDQIEKNGESKQYIRIGDSGGKIQYDFCPNCGTTVSWSIEGMVGFTVVALGCFADPKSFPDPVFSVYEDRAHSWALNAVPIAAERWG